MTTENRIVFDLEDLTIFRLACGSCRREVSFEIRGDYVPLKHCPYCCCSSPWSSDEWEIIVRILQDIKTVIRSDKSPLRLRLEIKQE